MVVQDLRKAMNNRNRIRSPVQTRPTAADIASRPGIDLLRMTFWVGSLSDLVLCGLHRAGTHIGTKGQRTEHNSNGTSIGYLGI